MGHRTHMIFFIFFMTFRGHDPRTPVRDLPLCRVVTGQKKNGHVPPGHLPPDIHPLDTYPLVIYHLGHIPPSHIPPGHIPPPPHNLKCLFWLMHHLLITYCTLKKTFILQEFHFIYKVDAVKLSHICCEEGFSPLNCSGSRWAFFV